MATSTATITAGVALNGKASTSQQDLEDAIEDMTIGDLSRDHVATGSSIPATGSTAPSASVVTAEIWVDPTDPDDGTGTAKVHTLNTWNGSAFRPVVSWFVSATAPTYTAGVGMGWYDTTLDIYRVYGTESGITGWHPVSDAYQLWHNATGATIGPNLAVVSDTTDATNIRSMATTTTIKHPGVVGVLLESTDDAKAGVVAVVGGGATCKLIALGAVTAVAKGDGLVQSATAGKAQTVGALSTNGYFASSERKSGVPLGCYAEALEASTSDTVAFTVKLLGSVGQGTDYHFARPASADFTDTFATDGGGAGPWAEKDLSAVLKDAKHGPIIGFYLECRFSADQGGAGSDIQMEFDFSVDQGTTINNNFYSNSDGEGIGNQVDSSGRFFQPSVNDTASPTALGELISVRCTNGTSTANATINGRVIGYRY